MRVLIKRRYWSRKKWREWLFGSRGLLIEKYFLRAANRLGYVVVEYTNERWAHTIRKTNQEEEREKKDYIITQKLHDEVVSIPLQLTLTKNKHSFSFRTKLKLAKEGKVALFWPGEGLTRLQFYKLLKNAAEGDPQALEDLKRGLDWAFEKYFKANKLNRPRMS